MVWYEGFEIYVSEYLGSGQPLYKIKGIVIEGKRAAVTTISAAKILIEQNIGSFVPLPTPVQEVMTQETLDQLNKGFLAGLELENLKAKVAEETTLMRESLASIGLSTTALEGVKQTIADTSGVVEGISEGLDQAKQDIVNTLGGEFQSLTDKFLAITESASASKASLEESKGLIADAVSTFEGAIATYQESLDILTKKLQDAQSVGFLKMIPYYVGAGLAVIVGIKVLGVMD